MAGSSEVQDNPVGINVVPMVDVIFCLCVFFMCSFRFQDREGRFEAWLPRDLGGSGSLSEPREMRVALYWDQDKGLVSRRFGARDVRDDVDLEALLRGSLEDHARVGALDVPLVVDGDPRIPWSAVLNIVNLGRRLDIAHVQFASSGN